MSSMQRARGPETPTFAAVIGASAASASAAAAAKLDVNIKNPFFSELRAKAADAASLDTLIGLVKSEFLRSFLHEVKYLLFDFCLEGMSGREAAFAKLLHFQKAHAIFEAHQPRMNSLEISVFLSIAPLLTSGQPPSGLGASNSAPRRSAMGAAGAAPSSAAAAATAAKVPAPDAADGAEGGKELDWSAMEELVAQEEESKSKAAKRKKKKKKKSTDSTFAAVTGANAAAASALAAQAGLEIDMDQPFFSELRDKVADAATLDALIGLIESEFLRAFFHEIKHLQFDAYFHQADDAAKLSHFERACALVEAHTSRATSLETNVLARSTCHNQLPCTGGTRKQLISRWHHAIRALLDRSSLGALLNPAQPAPPPRTRPRIRVGFFAIDRLECFSAVYRGQARIVTLLDRRRFETCLIVSSALAGSHPDLPEAGALWEAVDQHVGCADVREALQKVAALELDVLVYPEIGLHPWTCIMAYARLAPVQVTTWGHALTSGIPTIDFYFSSAWFEAEGAQEHYSETLVLMRSLSCCLPAFHFTGAPLEEALSLLPPPPAKLVCCLQPSLTLNMPFVRRTLPRILSRVPTAVFLFLQDGMSAKTLTAISQALDGNALFLPRGPAGWLRKYISRCAVFLDAHPCGSCNAMLLDAFLEGRVIVTLPGPDLQGRFAQGFYRKMGLTDPIAATEDAYVEQSVRYLVDVAERRRIERLIARRRGALVDERDSVSEWGNTLELVCKPWVQLIPPPSRLQAAREWLKSRCLPSRASAAALRCLPASDARVDEQAAPAADCPPAPGDQDSPPGVHREVKLAPNEPPAASAEVMHAEQSWSEC